MTHTGNSILARMAVVIAAVALTTTLAAHGQGYPACVPTLANASRARCTYDIWGYVTGTDGRPFVHIEVSDGNTADWTDADGFYDLTELQPATYHVSVGSVDCGRTDAVGVDPVHPLLDGGVRHDFELPCAAG